MNALNAFFQNAKKLLFINVLFFVSLNTAMAEQKIVSADGSLTEIVFALGQQDKLVGVDTTSAYPSATSKLPQIGYKRNISAEGVLSLSPTVLIATEDSGPAKIISQIEQTGISIETFSAKPSLESVKDKILGVATLLNVNAKGDALWKEVEQQVQDARNKLAKVDKPIKVLFVLSLANGSPIVSGKDTMADGIIELSGAQNAVQEFSGYKPMPVESIVSAAPDVILMMDRGGDHGASDSVLENYGFNLTPAGANKRLVKMNGMLMLGFGPRIGEAISGLSKAFYPEIFDINQ